MKSLREVLEAQGLEVIGAEQNVRTEYSAMNAEEFDNYELDKDVGAVVLGLDTNFTMNKLQLATLYINE